MPLQRGHTLREFSTHSTLLLCRPPTRNWRNKNVRDEDGRNPSLYSESWILSIFQTLRIPIILFMSAKQVFVWHTKKSSNRLTSLTHAWLLTPNLKYVLAPLRKSITFYTYSIKYLNKETLLHCYFNPNAFFYKTGYLLWTIYSGPWQCSWNLSCTVAQKMALPC